MSQKVMPEFSAPNAGRPQGWEMRKEEIDKLPAKLKASSFCLKYWWDRQTSKGSGADVVYWDCTPTKLVDAIDLRFLASMDTAVPKEWLDAQLRSTDHAAQAALQNNPLRDAIRRVLVDMVERREREKAKCTSEQQWRKLLKSGERLLEDSTPRWLAKMGAKETTDQHEKVTKVLLGIEDKIMRDPSGSVAIETYLPQIYGLIAVELGSRQPQMERRKQREKLLVASLKTSNYLLVTALLKDGVQWTSKCDQNFHAGSATDEWDQMPAAQQFEFAWEHTMHSNRPLFQALLYSTKFSDLAVTFPANATKYADLADKFSKLACNQLEQMLTHFDAAIALEEVHKIGGQGQRAESKTAIDIALEGQMLAFMSHPRVHRIMRRWWSAPLLRCPDNQAAIHSTGAASNPNETRGVWAHIRKKCADFWVPFESWTKTHHTGVVVPKQRWSHNSQQFTRREFVSPFDDGLAGVFRLFCYQPTQFFLLPQCAFILDQLFCLVMTLFFWGFVVYGHFSNAYEKDITSGEIVMLVWYLGHMVQEAVEFFGEGKYFGDAWNVLDVCLLVSGLLIGALRAIATQSVFGPVASVLGANSNYTNIVEVASNSSRRLVSKGAASSSSAPTGTPLGAPIAHNDGLALLHKLSVALTCILLGFRFLYVFTLSPSLGPLLRTIGKMCKKDVVAFAVVYLTIAAGFGAAFEYLASNEVGTSYGTQYRTQYSLLNAMIGEFDTQFDEAYGTTHAYFWLARMVLLVFIVFGNIIMLNLLIAMMGQTYSDVQERSGLEFSLGQKQTFWKCDQNRTNCPPPLNLFVWLLSLMAGMVERMWMPSLIEEKGVDVSWVCAYCSHTNAYNDLLRFSVLQRGNGVVARRLMLLAADSVGNICEEELKSAPASIMWLDVGKSINDGKSPPESCSKSRRAENLAEEVKRSPEAPRHHKVVNCHCCLRYRKELNRWHQHKAKIAVIAFKTIWFPTLLVLYVLMAARVAVFAVTRVPSILIGLTRRSNVLACVEDIDGIHKVVTDFEAKEKEEKARQKAAGMRGSDEDDDDDNEATEQQPCSPSRSRMKRQANKDKKDKTRRRAAEKSAACTELRDVRKITAKGRQALAHRAAACMEEETAAVDTVAEIGAQIESLKRTQLEQMQFMQQQLAAMRQSQEQQMSEMMRIMAATKAPQPRTTDI